MAHICGDRKDYVREVNLTPFCRKKIIHLNNINVLTLPTDIFGTLVEQMRKNKPEIQGCFVSLISMQYESTEDRFSYITRTSGVMVFSFK